MPTFTQDQLRKAAHHLGYEWAMLLGARHTDWHKLPATDPVQKIANENARVEIMLLHTRVMYEFLFGVRSNQHPDDMRAFDYLHGAVKDDWQLNRTTLAKKLCPSIDKDWDRLNKRLFHLSYQRIDLQTGWDPDIVIRELKAGFRQFCSLLNGGPELVLIHEGLVLSSVDPYLILGPA